MKCNTGLKWINSSNITPKQALHIIQLYSKLYVLQILQVALLRFPFTNSSINIFPWVCMSEFRRIHTPWGCSKILNQNLPNLCLLWGLAILCFYIFFSFLMIRSLKLVSDKFFVDLKHLYCKILNVVVVYNK